MAGKAILAHGAGHDSPAFVVARERRWCKCRHIPSRLLLRSDYRTLRSLSGTFVPRDDTTGRDHCHASISLYRNGETPLNDSQILQRCSAERRKTIRDSEKKDEPDTAAIDRARPCDQMVEARIASAGIKCSTKRGRH